MTSVDDARYQVLVDAPNGSIDQIHNFPSTQKKEAQALVRKLKRQGLPAHLWDVHNNAISDLFMLGGRRAR